MPGAGRVLGVDLGSVRIGLAASDPTRVLASPVAVLSRAHDHAADHEAIVAAAREASAGTIVVGVPFTLRGTVGPAARSVLEEIAELEMFAAVEDIAVEQWDERLTTVIADRQLRASGSRAPRKQTVDAAAATVILQSWLDAHPASERAR